MTRFAVKNIIDNSHVAQYECDSCDAIKTTVLQHKIARLEGASFYRFPGGRVKQLGS